MLSLLNNEGQRVLAPVSEGQGDQLTSRWSLHRVKSWQNSPKQWAWQVFPYAFLQFFQIRKNWKPVNFLGGCREWFQ